MSILNWESERNLLRERVSGLAVTAGEYRAQCWQHKRELEERQERIVILEAKIAAMRRELKRRDKAIIRLKKKEPQQ